MAVFYNLSCRNSSTQYESRIFYSVEAGRNTLCRADRPGFSVRVWPRSGVNQLPLLTDSGGPDPGGVVSRSVSRRGSRLEKSNLPRLT